ncbi:MAG: AGE family epimerase/isomerase, partial [Clostridia bacterium]
MNKELLKQQQLWIQEELKRCVEFWLKNGWDKKNGGVYTCLDREGKIYSTDKSVWMQGRCAWTFSYLCHCYGVKQEWLDMAKSCLDFMEAHCINREKGNRMYFTVTAEGKPLRQRRYNFSEGFYTLANAEYGALVHDDTYLQRARDTFEMIWKLNHGLMEDPVGMGPKTISETRKGRSLGNPMIYLNICSIMRRCDPENVALYDERSKQCIDDIFRYHHKPEMHCTLETVGMNGEVMDDVTEGRVVNPGHDIECSWFLMEYAKYSKDSELLKNACEVFNNAIDAGWD